jgi:ankyrin repeat protein
MGLLDLPLEINHIILTFLTLDSDITAFSRTSRSLHSSLDDYLYLHNIKYFGSYALEWAAIQGNAIVAQKILKAGLRLTPYAMSASSQFA